MGAWSQWAKMADVVRGVMAHEMDTNILFERLTVEEIRNVEKKTRSDIEKKKEDLRLMVGERYRELIEAADTIKDMKNCAENVVSSVSKMQDLCQSLKQRHLSQGVPSMTRVRKDSQRVRDESQFYGIAAQIKLLLDMPEKLWSAVESRSYLQASQLFLLARHINTGLQRDSQQSAKIMAWFPVLARQWAAISHFRTTILQACRDTLKEVDIPDKLAAECLCSIMLLEDTTPRQVFNELLLIRTSAVQQLFQPDQSDVSIKSQVCNVVQMIVTTVHQIYAVFYTGGESLDTQENKVACNLLMQIIAWVTSRGEDGAIIVGHQNAVAVSHLPQRVRDFRPSLQKHVAAISSQNLQDNCQQWVNTCIQTVSAGLSKLLGYITTVKGLAAIRDELWTLLKQDEKMLTWELVCKEVMQRPLHLWEEFFQEHFVARNKALLQSQFDSTLSQSKQQITKALADLASSTDRSMLMEHNISSYMWVETPGDIPANTAWVPTSNKTLAESGTLLMKAKAYTPIVQMLCRSVDGKLKVLLEDAMLYLQPPGEVNKDLGPFNKFANNEEIQKFLQTACQSCIERLLEFLTNQLYASKQQLSSSEDVQANIIILDGVILLGRLSCAIGELSINLEKCMLGGAERPDMGRGSKKVLGLKSKTNIPESPQWNNIKEQLAKFVQDAYSVWTEYTADLLVRQFRLVLLDNSGQALLHSTACWDEIEIQEETEEGVTVKSTIRVPMQASWYVHSFLYELCEEINRVGGHAVQRSVLQNLVVRLTDGLLQAFIDLLDNTVDKNAAGDGEMPLSQVRALQLMFDFRLLTVVLSRKEEDKANSEYQAKGRKVLDRLEAVIDPFDLDVFTPYINNHLIRQQQRTNVLYGALGSFDKHGLYSTPRQPVGSQQEQHNTFPLSTGHSRFPLLPLSVTQNRSNLPPVLQAPKPQGPGTPLGPSSPPPTLPPSPGPTTSFLGTMSTIWFTNVASKKK